MAQFVWIVRYGLTEFPLQENLGPYNSDLDPTVGMEHATAIAKRVGESSPQLVFSSPFLRTTRTAHMIASEAKATVCIEEGLTEWQIPSLLVDPQGVKTHPEDSEALSKKFSTIDTTYTTKNPHVADDADPVPEGAPKFEESEEALITRCRVTMERLLDYAGGKSIAIVSHAPCDQAMAVFLEGKGVEGSALGPWPLGGITRFSRKEGGEWKLDFYGDTEHMPGEYKNGLKEWSLPCLQKL